MPVIRVDLVRLDDNTGTRLEHPGEVARRAHLRRIDPSKAELLADEGPKAADDHRRDRISVNHGLRVHVFPTTSDGRSRLLPSYVLSLPARGKAYLPCLPFLFSARFLIFDRLDLLRTTVPPYRKRFWHVFRSGYTQTRYSRFVHRKDCCVRDALIPAHFALQDSSGAQR